MPLLINPGRALLWGGRASMQARSVLWVKAKGSNGVLVDGSGRGHAIQHGSAAGADSNDPLFLAYTGTQYAYFPGTSGNYASSPDSAAVSVTGDIDLRVEAALDDWTPSVAQALLAKWTSTNRSYFLRLASAGNLVLFLGQDASTVASATSSVTTGIADGAAKWVRATWRQSDGRVQFFTSNDGSTWTQLGTDQTISLTGIYDNAGVVEVGSDQGGTADLAQGKFYRAQIYGDLLGTDLRFDADFTDASRLTEPFSTFLEKSANAATVTINRSASGRKSTVVDRDLYLLGTDDYFEIADAADLNFALAESLTAVAVIRVHGTAATATVIAKKSNLGGLAGWALYLDASSKPNAIVADGTNLPNVAGSALSAGVATLVGVLRNAASTLVEAAKDGTLTTTADTDTGSSANAVPMRIGLDNTHPADMVFFGAAVLREVLSAADLARVKQELLS